MTASTHLDWSFFEPRRRQLAELQPLLIGRELLRKGLLCTQLANAA